MPEFFQMCATWTDAIAVVDDVGDGFSSNNVSNRVIQKRISGLIVVVVVIIIDVRQLLILPAGTST